MSKAIDKLEVVRGSGNIFADFRHPNAAAELIKARLAAEIIKVMDARQMTARQAAARTSIAITDFSRIRNVKLDRFTIDRLVMILESLDQLVSFKVTAKPKGRTHAVALAP